MAITTFGAQLFHESQQDAIYREAQDTANANGAPVMIMARDGWLTICEEPPDDAECDPYGHGWQDYALVAPSI